MVFGLPLTKLISSRGMVVTGEHRHIQTWESQINETEALEQKVRCDRGQASPQNRVGVTA